MRVCIRVGLRVAKLVALHHDRQHSDRIRSAGFRQATWEITHARWVGFCILTGHTEQRLMGGIPWMPKMLQQRLMLPGSPSKTKMNAGFARVDAARCTHAVGREDGGDERTSSSARRTMSSTACSRRVGFDPRESEAACGAVRCAASQRARGS